MEIILGFIVMGCTWLVYRMVVKLAELLFDWQAQMSEWMHDRDGITLAKVICLPLWAALSLFVIGLTLLGLWSAYSVAKSVFQDFSGHSDRGR